MYLFLFSYEMPDACEVIQAVEPKRMNYENTHVYMKKQREKIVLTAGMLSMQYNNILLGCSVRIS